jgi:D-glycero-alpha-D-manno-heptose-7-phosphate kinase
MLKITRTPLRISFVGGGTDIQQFYERHGGAVVSMTVDKYIYVSLNRKFDNRIRLSYSRTENVVKASDLKHDIARVCLEGITGVEVTSVSDIPGAGSGLGSSSSFAVGLINAIRHMPSVYALAEVAYLAELSCGHGCGKQDHLAAAYGGLHFFKFLKSGHVEVEPITPPEGFQEQLMLFWTGKTRKAAPLLKKQSENISENGLAEYAALDMRDLAYKLRSDLIDGDIFTLGECLHNNWELKKKLAEGISNRRIDELYSLARSLGATGGKVCGAGGGGFLLLCADPSCHERIEKAIGLRRIPIKMSEEGSKVIYDSEA